MVLTIAYTGRVPECRVLLDRRLVNVLPVPITHRVDLGLSIVGTHLFTPDEIALAHCGIVNLHLAPLPEYRGRWSAAHAVENGETEYRVTLHYIEQGIDTGPVIAVRSFEAPMEVEALRQRARAEGIRLFADTLPYLLDAAGKGQRLRSLPQDESKARYYDRHSC